MCGLKDLMWRKREEKQKTITALFADKGNRDVYLAIIFHR